MKKAEPRFKMDTCYPQPYDYWILNVTIQGKNVYNGKPSDLPQEIKQRLIALDKSQFVYKTTFLREEFDEHLRRHNEEIELKVLEIKQYLIENNSLQSNPKADMLFYKAFDPRIFNSLNDIDSSDPIYVNNGTHFINDLANEIEYNFKSLLSLIQ